jgi:predicted TIM-barrel fold metal-dependent hydrolase
MNDTIYRVDTHHHILPDFYRQALEDVGQASSGGSPLPPWNAADALSLMDRQGIEIAITSISAPGVYFGDVAFARDLARRCNDYSAELTRTYPTRFGALGILPLPDVDAALREIEYVFDTLGLNGVILLASYGNRYVGDKEWEAVMAELNRRRAVVLLHPTTPPGSDVPALDLPPFVAEFTFDTTRAIANLIFSGTLERYPDIRIIAAHAGGTAPFLRGRFEMAETLIPKLREAAPQGSAAYLKRLYYDTAIAARPEVFHALKSAADGERILFGSDYPYLPEALIADGIRGVREQDAFVGAATEAIERANALALFPYLTIQGMTG